MTKVRAVGALGMLTSKHPSLPASLPALAPTLPAFRGPLTHLTFIDPILITSIPSSGGVGVGAYLDGSRTPATPTLTVAPLPDLMGEADVDVLAKPVAKERSGTPTSAPGTPHLAFDAR